MLTVEEIRAALQDRRLYRVAAATGLHYNTLRDIRDGTAVDIKLSTAAVLTWYFNGGALVSAEAASDNAR